MIDGADRQRRYYASSRRSPFGDDDEDDNAFAKPSPRTSRIAKPLASVPIPKKASIPRPPVASTSGQSTPPKPAVQPVARFDWPASDWLRETIGTMKDVNQRNIDQPTVNLISPSVNGEIRRLITQHSNSLKELKEEHSADIQSLKNRHSTEVERLRAVVKHQGETIERHKTSERSIVDGLLSAERETMNKTLEHQAQWRREGIATAEAEKKAALDKLSSENKAALDKLTSEKKAAQDKLDSEEQNYIARASMLATTQADLSKANHMLKERTNETKNKTEKIEDLVLALEEAQRSRDSAQESKRKTDDEMTQLSKEIRTVRAHAEVGRAVERKEGQRKSRIIKLQPYDDYRTLFAKIRESINRASALDSELFGSMDSRRSTITNTSKAIQRYWVDAETTFMDFRERVRLNSKSDRTTKAQGKTDEYLDKIRDMIHGHTLGERQRLVSRGTMHQDRLVLQESFATSAHASRAYTRTIQKLRDMDKTMPKLTATHVLVETVLRTQADSELAMILTQASEHSDLLDLPLRNRTSPIIIDQQKEALQQAAQAKISSWIALAPPAEQVSWRESRAYGLNRFLKEVLPSTLDVSVEAMVPEVKSDMKAIANEHRQERAAVQVSLRLAQERDGGAEPFELRFARRVIARMAKADEEGLEKLKRSWPPEVSSSPVTKVQPPTPVPAPMTRRERRKARGEAVKASHAWVERTAAEEAMKQLVDETASKYMSNQAEGKNASKSLEVSSEKTDTATAPAEKGEGDAKDETSRTLAADDDAKQESEGQASAKPPKGSSLFRNVMLRFTPTTPRKSLEVGASVEAESFYPPATTPSEDSQEPQPLCYQIPSATLEAARTMPQGSEGAYWSYTMYRSPDKQSIKRYYCTHREVAEVRAREFLGEKVLGLDLEWEVGAKAGINSVKDLVSVIQLAAEDKVAIFHIALFSGSSPSSLIPPSLKTILEDASVVKAGVNIGNDFYRLEKFLGIKGCGIFELSHLYKLVRYSESNPGLVDRKPVKLAKQVEHILGLPMYKGEVRTSAWSRKLNTEQCDYAASDAYAGFRLYREMDDLRRGLKPTPPMPELWETKAPILLADGTAPPKLPKKVADVQRIVEAKRREAAHTAAGRKDAGKDETSLDEALGSLMLGDEAEPIPTEREGSTEIEAVDDQEALAPDVATDPRVIEATTWSNTYRARRQVSHRQLARASCLRAYHLWHKHSLSVEETASLLRTPPLKESTVKGYIVESAGFDSGLPFETDRMRAVMEGMPGAILLRFKGLTRKVESTR